MVKKLFIHFEVENQYINADEFVQTVNSILTTYHDFTSNVLEIKGESKLIILPPEKGSFLTTFAIIGGCVWAFIDACDKEVLKKFIKGLTGNEPAYYAEKGGELLRDCIKEFCNKTTRELKAIIPEIINLDASINAKSEFYKMCIRNPDIKGVGYDDSNVFPIKRNSFHDYTSENIVRELTPETKIQELIVEKPVTTDRKRKWGLKDTNTGDYLNASFEDNSFINSFLHGGYPLKESSNPDIIIAKVEYQKELINGEEKPKNTIITDVYKFNDKQIKPLPENISLNQPIQPEDNGQIKLFKETDL